LAFFFSQKLQNGVYLGFIASKINKKELFTSSNMQNN